MKRHTFYRMGRWLLGTGSLLLLAWGMAPLFTSRIHVGCVVLMAAGVLGIGTAAALRPLRSLWLDIWHKKAGRAVLSTLLTLVGSLAALFMVVSGMMIYAACAAPQRRKRELLPEGGARQRRGRHFHAARPHVGCS